VVGLNCAAYDVMDIIINAEVMDSIILAGRSGGREPANQPEAIH